MTAAVWTPERTQRLIALWKEGRTAAWIADVLGAGVSRCAVLGKVYRLGLARGPRARPVRAAQADTVRRRRESVAASRSVRQSGPSKVGAAARSSTSTAAIATPPCPTVTILSVKAGQCRWPYGCSGEAGFGLCGRSVARGAFCAAHAEIGYQKRPCAADLLKLVCLD